jgi:hypothetical protein
VNSDNSIEKEIQYRITLGNKAYYTKQFFFKSRLISKKSKLKLYWSIIRPTVTYGCETWVLKETIKNKLMVFERKVLTHCGLVTQICGFTLQLCRTGDADLRF